MKMNIYVNFQIYFLAFHSVIATAAEHNELMYKSKKDAASADFSGKSKEETSKETNTMTSFGAEENSKIMVARNISWKTISNINYKPDDIKVPFTCLMPKLLEISLAKVMKSLFGFLTDVKGCLNGRDFMQWLEIYDIENCELYKGAIAKLQKLYSDSQYYLTLNNINNECATWTSEGMFCKSLMVMEAIEKKVDYQTRLGSNKQQALPFSKTKTLSKDVVTIGCKPETKSDFVVWVVWGCNDDSSKGMTKTRVRIGFTSKGEMVATEVVICGFSE